MSVYQTFSSAETKAFGRRLAREVISRGPRGRHAIILSLTGEIGSGKTTFTQGFFRGLGIRRRITSPTFILIRRTALKRRKGRKEGFTNAYHVDAYRIRTPRELIALGIRDIFRISQNIILIEWADRVERLLPKDALRLTFRHGRGAQERFIITGE